MKLLEQQRLPELLTTGEVLIGARGVTARLSGDEILRGIDLDIYAGELVALVGPNGAGKSTLLGVLAGDIEASSGVVHVHGAPLRSWSLTELAQRRSVLPQTSVVSFPFRVREVVAMGRAPWGRTPREDDDDAVIDAAIEAAGVASFADRPYTALSGGERARVAFARLLAQQTQCILLDEPTAALDIHHQEVLLKVVRDLTRDGAGALAVMHDLSLAAAHADRVALMRRGTIVAVGAPREVLTPELLSDVYEHGIDVIEHPRTHALLISPERYGPATPGGRLAPRD